MSEPICTVMVGLPGLGKSTLVEDQRKVYERIDMDLFVYSTDGILERIAAFLGKTYDDVFKKHIKSATAEADIDLAYAIKERQDIIWDQTNLGAKKRAKIINRMRQAGYDVECECIVPPESDYDGSKEDWVERLANRPGKTIPDNILYNMMDSFVMPKVEEGFERVAFFNMYGALVSIEYNETA